MEGRPQQAADAMTNEEQYICIVCQDSLRDVRFHECGHSHTCALCTLKLIAHAANEPTCLMCKSTIVRIEDWGNMHSDGCLSQPEYAKGGAGGTSIDMFIKSYEDAADVNLRAAAHRARMARSARLLHYAPQGLMMDREVPGSATEYEHSTQTRDLAGCWVNLCAVPLCVPCSLYLVTHDAVSDSLTFRGVGCCICGLAVPVAGRYWRDPRSREVLLIVRASGAMGAQSFVVQSTKRMESNIGGKAFKLC